MGPSSSTRAPERDRLGAHKSLIALCVGGNLLDAALLGVLDPTSAIALAPQATMVVPFGVFHDLRWLLVYSRSWLGVAGEGFALLVGRSVITALSIREAWPPGAPRPRLGPCLIRAGLFSLAAAMLLAPFAALLFGLAVAPVSWFWFAAVPGALIVAMLFHHGAIAPGWARHSLSVRAIGWILAAFGVASVSGAIISFVPEVWAVAVAGVAGLANAQTWLGLVGSVIDIAADRRFRPVAPVGLVGFVAVLVGGTTLGFAVVAPARTTLPAVSAARTVGTTVAAGTAGAVANRIAVLVVAGYGTTWNGRSTPGLPGPFLERRFSYRGLGPAGTPLPYSSVDTDQPLIDLEHLMALQVQSLHAATHESVAIVAESEGSLVAKAYLAASGHTPVRYLVMTSPLIQPGRVSYPRAGTAGWGLAGGQSLRIIADAIKPVSPIPLSPGSPFLGSIVAGSADLISLLSCPLPGVTQGAILPLADAVASPSGRQLGIPTMVITAFHGGMLTNPAADAAIIAVLSGHALPSAPASSLADRIVRAAASAWQVPSLAPPIQPAPCGEIKAQLSAQLRISSEMVTSGPPRRLIMDKELGQRTQLGHGNG